MKTDVFMYFRFQLFNTRRGIRFILNSVVYFFLMIGELLLKNMNATSGNTATKEAGIMMAGLLFPKPRREKLGTVCVRLQRRRWCVSPLFIIFVFCALDLLPQIPLCESAVAQTTAFTQRGLCALLFVWYILDNADGVQWGFLGCLASGGEKCFLVDSFKVDLSCYI